MRILLALLLLQYAASTPPAQTPVQPAGERLVLSYVNVFAPTGGYVTGLREDAFTVFDEKWPREVKYFSHEDEPLSIAILFDLSESMLGGPMTDYDLARIKLLREHFPQFVRAANPSNEYFVVGFNTQARLLAEGVSGEEAVLSAEGLLSSDRPKGKTAFYDACYSALESLARGRHRKKAILVISDGQDTASRRKLSDLRRSLAKDAPVMFFGVSVPGFRGAPEEGRAAMEELAGATGGRVYFPEKARELFVSFNVLAVSLRNQYTLGFVPEGTATGDKWRRLKVEVRPPPNSPVRQKDIFIRSRAGYYSAR